MSAQKSTFLTSKLNRFLLFAVLIFLFCNFGSGNTFAFSSTFSSTGDTYVSSVSPTGNMGTLQVLTTGYGDIAYYTFIKFSIPGIPSYATINSAKLRLFVDRVVLACSLNIYRVTEKWGETSVTWNTIPLYEYDNVTGYIQKTQQRSFVDIDVKETVKKWVNSGKPNYGFMITIPAGRGTLCDFLSSEITDSSRAPKLVVSYSIPVINPITPTIPVYFNPSPTPTPTPTPTRVPSRVPEIYDVDFPNKTVNSITATSAKISWNTQVPLTSILSYGVWESNNGGEKKDLNLKTYHEFTITGLHPDSDYVFYLAGLDVSGNTYNDEDADYTENRFRTKSVNASPSEEDALLSDPNGLSLPSGEISGSPSGVGGQGGASPTVVTTISPTQANVPLEQPTSPQTALPAQGGLPVQVTTPAKAVSEATISSTGGFLGSISDFFNLLGGVNTGNSKVSQKRNLNGFYLLVLLIAGGIIYYLRIHSKRLNVLKGNSGGNAGENKQVGFETGTHKIGEPFKKPRSRLKLILLTLGGLFVVTVILPLLPFLPTILTPGFFSGDKTSEQEQRPVGEGNDYINRPNLVVSYKDVPESVKNATLDCLTYSLIPDKTKKYLCRNLYKAEEQSLDDEANKGGFERIFLYGQYINVDCSTKTPSLAGPVGDCFKAAKFMDNWQIEKMANALGTGLPKKKVYYYLTETVQEAGERCLKYSSTNESVGACEIPMGNEVLVFVPGVGYEDSYFFGWGRFLFFERANKGDEPIKYTVTGGFPVGCNQFDSHEIVHILNAQSIKVPVYWFEEGLLDLSRETLRKEYCSPGMIISEVRKLENGTDSPLTGKFHPDSLNLEEPLSSLIFKLSEGNQCRKGIFMQIARGIREGGDYYLRELYKTLGRINVSSEPSAAQAVWESTNRSPTAKQFLTSNSCQF